MDLSWITGLSPAQSAVLIVGIVVILGGVAAVLALARHLGLSVSKDGLSFKTSEKTDAILETVTAIKESDVRQEAEIKRLCVEVNKNTRDTLRLTFYNEALSPAERLIAGKRYLTTGGNGETQRAIDRYAGEHPEVWQAILAVSKKTEEDDGHNS
ncbi:MAG: hypothetical protein LBB98_08885 [Treponema sp.]|nr:hypothetical protein [Treponema sp.]